jgi:predicted transcriptional regulator
MAARTKASQTRANSARLIDTVKKRPETKLLSTRTTSVRPPGFLPAAVAKQPVLAQRAFTLLVAKPGRSLRSIAQELGTTSRTLSHFSQAANWPANLALVFSQDSEALIQEAKHEARRSRGELLASNRIREGLLEAATEKMFEVNEFGKIELKPGVDVQDVQRLQMAMANHMKVTMLLTGEEQSLRRGVAQASASKVVIDMRHVNPEPVPVSGEITR